MNRIFLIGNLTRDPELTETQSGVKICRFQIAINRAYTSNTDGERKTDYFSCIAWRGLAETVAKYTVKGRKVCVVGSMESRKTDKGTYWDVIAQDVEFLTSKDNAGHTAANGLEPIEDGGDIPF